jgi:ubiquinol-cytochrome c reductase iron-sulfur subunit
MEPMAETITGPVQAGMAEAQAQEPTKRDFLKLTTAAFAAVGAAGIAWPFLFSLAPSRDVLALASTRWTCPPSARGRPSR